MVALVTLPSISVVIPTHNGDAWIADTLASVFTQTYLPHEVIVVDDASIDDTAQCVIDLAIDAPVPVQLIRQEVNSGAPAPVINIGIARATGELIAVLDQDDSFLPTKLETQARALAENLELSFVLSLFRRDPGFGGPWDVMAARWRVRHLKRRTRPSNGVLHCDGSTALEAIALSSSNFFGGFPGFMFRREAWEEKGGIDERFTVGADFDFLCWLCTQGAVGLIPEIHYQRREHGTNLSRNTGIRGHLDVVIALLRYSDVGNTSKTRRTVRKAIHRHLWDIARRLASGGHSAAAREVSSTLAEIIGPGRRIPVQRLTIPAYVGFNRLLGRPWQISADQADEAAALTRTAFRQLGSS